MQLMTLILGALEIDVMVSCFVMMYINGMDIRTVNLITLYILEFSIIILMQFIVTFSNRKLDLKLYNIW